MLFNSFQFLFFFAVVYTLYRFLPFVWQNRMLLMAGYIFYGAWDVRFLLLLIFSTVMDYFFALKIGSSSNEKTKKTFLVLSIVVNLGILGFFKYFNFFTENVAFILNLFGVQFLLPTLRIILPVGISFYTFQSMGYMIDVHRGRMEPVKNFWDYALFVAFFPQLVAGPIERAPHMMPQLTKPRTILPDHIRDGLFLFIWGMFKKVFIADNLAIIANAVFAKQGGLSGWEIVLGAYAFTFQLYCDFSGYSDIARGIAKLMGFDIFVNFKLPFFVTNIQEFWNKWHISLSQWIRDYLYTPLFLAMRWLSTNLRLYVSLILTMALMGLWHGARWTYVAWGIYNGVLLMVYAMIKNNAAKWISPKNAFGKALWFWLEVVFMFQITAFGMLIFRSESLHQVAAMTQGLFGHWEFSAETLYHFKSLLFFIFPLLLVEITQFFKEDLMWIVSSSWKTKVTLAALVASHAIVIYLIGMPKPNEFIYFQF